MTLSESVSNHDLQRVTIFCGLQIRAIEGVQFAQTGRVLVVSSFQGNTNQCLMSLRRTKKQQEAFGKMSEDLKPTRIGKSWQICWSWLVATSCSVKDRNPCLIIWVGDGKQLNATSKNDINFTRTQGIWVKPYFFGLRPSREGRAQVSMCRIIATL